MKVFDGQTLLSVPFTASKTFHRRLDGCQHIKPEKLSFNPSFLRSGKFLVVITVRDDISGSVAKHEAVVIVKQDPIRSATAVTPTYKITNSGGTLNICNVIPHSGSPYGDRPSDPNVLLPYEMLYLDIQSVHQLHEKAIQCQTTFTLQYPGYPDRSYSEEQCSAPLLGGNQSLLRTSFAFEDADNQELSMIAQLFDPVSKESCKLEYPVKLKVPQVFTAYQFRFLRDEQSGSHYDIQNCFEGDRFLVEFFATSYAIQSGRAELILKCQVWRNVQSTVVSSSNSLNTGD